MEPEKFSITVDGEIVTKVEPRLGYVHRGIEKATESRTFVQDIYMVERVCGICNPCHAYGFVGAVEKILKTDVPEQASPASDSFRAEQAAQPLVNFGSCLLRNWLRDCIPVFLERPRAHHGFNRVD